MPLNLTRPLAVLDVESTGADPCVDRIIEFGTVVLYPDGSRERWCQRFDPGIPIPAEATECHHITDADVAGCPPFSEWAVRIALGLRGKDLAGYNLARFDLVIIDEELRRCGIKLDLSGVQVIDAFGIFQKKEPRKLEDAVRRYCGREHEGKHGAAADAEATLDVLMGQVVAYEDVGAMDLGALAEFSRQSDQRYADVAGKLTIDAQGEVCYGFGKHKGVRVKDETGYASWMLKKGSSFPGSTCDVLRQILGWK